MTGATAVIEAQGSSTAPPGRGAGVSPVSDYDTTGATDKTTTMPDIASVHAPDKPASMFRAKLLYFVFCATNGTLYPFLVLWFEHIGLDAEHIGILRAAYPIMMILGGPLWGAIADLTLGPRFALVLAVTGTAVLRCALALPALLHSGASSGQPDGVAAFPWLIVVAFAAEFFAAPVFPLLDSACMQLLGPERRSEWGRTRLWGAVGWGIVAPIAGFIVDQTSPLASFVMFPIGMVLSVIITCYIPAPVQEKPEHSFCASMSKLLRSGPIVSFLAVATCMGTMMGVISNYLFLYLESLGAANWFLGLTLTATAVCEVPVFYFAGGFIKKHGVMAGLALALVCYLIRLVAYSILTKPVTFLPIELLHGFTYGAGWAACTTYGSIVAPKGFTSSMMGLLSASHWGVGLGLGSVLGGWLYESYGAVNMFRATCGVGVLGLALAAVARMCARNELARKQAGAIAVASSDDDGEGGGSSDVVTVAVRDGSKGGGSDGAVVELTSIGGSDRSGVVTRVAAAAKRALGVSQAAAYTQVRGDDDDDADDEEVVDAR